MDGAQSQITSLLTAVGSGDTTAAQRLWHLVYDELHRIAKAKLARQGCRGDLQTTVLVQEAYLRLIGDGEGAPMPAHRGYFFAAAANAMRQFLVDDARKRGRLKRGGSRRPGALGEAAAALNHDPAEVLALDEALAKLRTHDERKAEIVQLRFFAGLSIDETAEMLEISPRMVDKEWRFAKAWLLREVT